MGNELALFDLPPRFDGDWIVRRVGHRTAEQWVRQWHYTGYPHAVTIHWYGAFCPDLACVISIGLTANEHGVAAKFDLKDWPGNVEITRIVAHPDAPTNTVSRTLAGAMRLLRGEGYDWCFTYADTGQNHHGGIYQAVNAVYVGLNEARPGYLLDGVPTHPRQIVHLFGTQGDEAFGRAAQRGQTLERIAEMTTPKHTYIIPIGSPTTRRLIRRRLALIALPYPSRYQPKETE